MATDALPYNVRVQVGSANVAASNDTGPTEQARFAVRGEAWMITCS
jgi:hypothetical protein